MLSLDKNPFSWNERGNISGLMGALSLTTKDGSNIPVENLSEGIEVSAAAVHHLHRIGLYTVPSCREHVGTIYTF